MRKIALATLVLVGLFGVIDTRAANASSASGDSEAVEFVRNFFSAFDRRDVPYMRRQFEEAALVVHDDGVVNTVPELMQVIAGAKAWAPRKRELSKFRVETLSPSVYLVICANRVVFDPDTPHPSEYNYTETWVLRRQAGVLKAVRSHYSLVTQKAHSEESNQ